MKLRVPLSLAAVGLLAVPLFSSASGAGEDQIGKTVPKFSAPTYGFLDTSGQATTTCYVFVGVKCGATPGYVKRIKTLEGEFRGKGVDFVYVFPNKTESMDEKLAWHEQQGLRGVMVDDEGAKFAKSLGIGQTASAVIVDKDGKVIYSGGIDDNRSEGSVQRRHVAEALNEHLGGKTVSVTTSKAFG